VTSVAERTTTTPTVSQRLRAATTHSDSTVLGSGELGTVLVELSAATGSKVDDGLRLVHTVHTVHTVLVATPATVSATTAAAAMTAIMVPRRHVGSAVHIAKSVRVMHRRVTGMTLTVVVAVTTATPASRVTTAASTATAVVGAKVHVTLLLTVSCRCGVGVVVTAHLLALELGLDPLAVRSVADHRENRSDAVDKQHTLTRFGVVQRSLDDVVGERVSQQLLKATSVEQLADEDLPLLRIGNSDALKEESKDE